MFLFFVQRIITFAQLRERHAPTRVGIEERPSAFESGAPQFFIATQQLGDREMDVFWSVVVGLFLLLTLVAWPIWPYSRDWTLKTSLVGIAGILIIVISFWVGLISLWPLVS